MNINVQRLGHPIGATRSERRRAGRAQLAIPGRVIWRDSRGTPRFSSIVTRDVSAEGALVECLSGPAIPVHRLVHVQLDRSIRGFEFLPPTLREGKVLAAVFRVGVVSRVTGLPESYALRLLVDPARAAASLPAVAFGQPEPVARLA